MCDMRYGTIECRGDGYLWDADCDGYDPNDYSMPCPQCNTKAYLLDIKDDAETTSFYSDMCGSGDGSTIWETGVKTATYWNPEGMDGILKEIGKVEACVGDGVGDVKVFLYN